MTDIFPSGVEVFTEQSEHSENNTILVVISKADNKNNIFVFDRGVNKRDAFKDMDNNGISFVTRVSQNCNHEVISSNELQVKNHKNLEILSDQNVYLFQRKGKRSIPLRLIITRQMDKKKEQILFLTNCNDLQIDEVIDIYKKRWDIEVFFRLIK